MNKKQKILFVAEELSMNGAMKSLVALLKALPQDRYLISLFLFRHIQGGLTGQVPSHVDVLPEIPSYRMLRLPLKEAFKESIKNFRFDLTLMRGLVAWQRYRNCSFALWPVLPNIPGRYDVVCSYADGFVAPLILKKVKSKATACWVHYMYSMMPQPEYVYEALRKCNVCVPVSYEAGAVLNEALGCNVNTQVIHNITDAEVCRCLSEAPDQYSLREAGAIRVVSIGRVTDAKHFDIIPATALILKNRGVKFEWLIAGSGDKLPDIQKQVENMGVSDCVSFLGEVPNPMPLLKSADIFVNPSRHESWGMTVSEALCLGKVVITSNLKVFEEQITNGVNGLMVEPTSENIADVIMDVLADKGLRSRLESEAVHYPYTTEKIVAEFDTLVKQLLDQPKTR